MRKILRLGRVALLSASMLANAADWPHYRGPADNGTSPETGLLKTWPEGGPKTLWKVALGPGYASPAVRDGEVYVLDRMANAQDVLRCLSLATGAELWRYAYDAPGKLSHDGSRSVPTVTEEHVFTIGPFGHMHCIDRTSHEPVWTRNVLEDFKGKLPRWGVAQSPVILRDAVIVTPMSKEAGVVALSKATGKELWRSPPVGDLAYVTPIVATLCGVEQIVAVSATRAPRGEDGAGSGKDGKKPPRRGRPKEGPELIAWLSQVSNRVVGVAADDGRLLWSFDDWHCMNPIPSPTPLGGDRVFLTGGYYAGSVMLQIGAKDGKFSASALFKNADYGAQIAYPVLCDEHLYLMCNGNFRKNGLVCMDLQGNVKWKADKDPAFDRGHLLLADGLIYSLDGAKGLLRLIRPSPDEYRQIAQAEFPRGPEQWAPLALSDGRLLVRGSEELRCLDVRQGR